MKLQNEMSCFGALLFAMAIESGDVGWITITGLFFFFWLVLAWYWRGSPQSKEVAEKRACPLCGQPLEDDPPFTILQE